MAKMGEEFNEMEMMGMMQGSFAAVPNFAKRMQGVIRPDLPDRGQTREGRKVFVDKALETLKEIIHLPEKTKAAIYEEFDPVMLVNETLEEKLPGLFDQFLDFEGSDQAFVALMKKLLTEIIGKFISEIEDGFIEEGMTDIIPFIRENMKALLKASCPPANYLMAELMGIPPIMAFINSANTEYKKMKEGE